MVIDAILSRCRDLGVTLIPKGDRLLVRAVKQPPDNLTQALHEHKHEIITKLQHAEEVARRTEELLASRGWCLWRCKALGGEVIGVIDDDLTSGEDIPQGYAIYTYSEMCYLFGPDAPPMGQSTLRLIHEAKRLKGVVTGRESDGPKG